jgi:hypothetical protein
MRTSTRLSAMAAAATLALVPIADAARHKVKVPRSGHFHGDPEGRPMDLYTSGKTIDLAAFDFKCRNVKGVRGRTSINDIRMKWTKKGYRFGLNTHGNITYSDEQSDENGAISFWGRFTPAGNRVKGTYRVKSSRCGSTGTVEWRAKR